MPTISLRPALATLAAAPETTTVRKLWRALSADERAQAVGAALTDDENGWVRATTRTAVAGVLKFRPQTVATWPRAKLIAEAARLPVDDVQLLSAYLIDLHLGQRRPMMTAFLDDLGIANDEGRIDSEKTEVPRQESERLRRAADALVTRFPADEVATYFLTLLLQDGATWGGLGDWLRRIAA
jgi:hypothetical protein